MKKQIESVHRYVKPSVSGVRVVYSVIYVSGSIRRWDISKKCRDSFSDVLPWYTSEIISDHFSFLPESVSSFIRFHVPITYERSAYFCHTAWG